MITAAGRTKHLFTECKCPVRRFITPLESVLRTLIIITQTDPCVKILFSFHVLFTSPVRIYSSQRSKQIKKQCVFLP